MDLCSTPRAHTAPTWPDLRQHLPWRLVPLGVGAAAMTHTYTGTTFHHLRTAWDSTTDCWTSLLTATAPWHLSLTVTAFRACP